MTKTATAAMAALKVVFTAWQWESDDVGGKQQTHACVSVSRLCSQAWLVWLGVSQVPTHTYHKCSHISSFVRLHKRCPRHVEPKPAHPQQHNSCGCQHSIVWPVWIVWPLEAAHTRPNNASTLQHQQAAKANQKGASVHHSACASNCQVFACSPQSRQHHQ